MLSRPFKVRCYFTAMIWYHYSKYTPPLSMLAILESSNLRDSNMQAFYSRQYATFFDAQHTTNVGSRFTAAIQNGGTFMKIKNVAIKNFRGYSDEINSDFEDLTAFVGKNDIGKSTILEALDIFFNDGKGATKLDKADLNVESKARQETDISIRVCFTDLPEKIVIDATNETSLSAEYLLNSDGLLEVVKHYPNAGTAKVFICAMHPTNPECADLLSKKDSDLRKIIETRGIPCGDKTRNSAMRTAIWSYYGDDLQVNSVELDVTKGDAKPIWEKLQKYLPVYSLFQADRKNSDSDSEVQDPLHAAVKEILQDEGISQTLDHVAEIVEGKLQEVATRTLEKLREMSPDIANTLSPVIPPASSLKWADVFKAVTISGDESIPINKRGSGSKRLILLNFFRAEVERRKDEANAPGIIYAIEEPETSQHSENQKKLINALIALSAESNVQVIITTHSAVLVNALDFKNIRLICADGSRKRVETVRSGQLPFSSLNEVNYLAFSEISEGYHDELYGYLKEQGWLNEYKQGKATVSYKRLNTDGTTREQQICMTEYIRHQIHHPENTYNARFNDSQLRRSIEDMRAFVTSKAQTSGTT